MNGFTDWFTDKMTPLGYVKTYSIAIDGSVWLSFLDKENGEGFHVCYVFKPITADEIRKLFESHNEPILFVVDAHLFDDQSVIDDPPLWMRALHAIYYGRIYTWSDWGIFVAYHFDWQTKTIQFSEPLELEGILFTDTDCKLRDFPGVFHIARFYDKAFWKEQPAQEPPPKREKKQRKPYEESDVFKAFRRAFEEQMRRAQQRDQQTYNQRPNRYNIATDDKWLQGFMSTGNLATARAMYKQLAKEWHPDLNPGKPEALETMQLINIAFDKVKDILR